MLSWLCLATSSSARFGAVSPIYLCERFCTLSSDGLVCGIAADANPYHSHYTYCQNSIHRKQSQPGPNYDHDYNLHSRDSAAVYVGRCSVGLHTAALAVLATSCRDRNELRDTHSSHQGLVCSSVGPVKITKHRARTVDRSSDTNPLSNIASLSAGNYPTTRRSAGPRLRSAARRIAVLQGVG